MVQRQRKNSCRAIRPQGWHEEAQSLGLTRHARQRVRVVFGLGRQLVAGRQRSSWPQRGLATRESRRQLEGRPGLLSVGGPLQIQLVRPSQRPRFPCGPQLRECDGFRNRLTRSLFPVLRCGRGQNVCKVPSGAGSGCESSGRPAYEIKTQSHRPTSLQRRHPFLQQ